MNTRSTRTDDSESGHFRRSDHIETLNLDIGSSADERLTVIVPLDQTVSWHGPRRPCSLSHAPESPLVGFPAGIESPTVWCTVWCVAAAAVPGGQSDPLPAAARGRSQLGPARLLRSPAAKGHAGEALPLQGPSVSRQLAGATSRLHLHFLRPTGSSWIRREERWSAETAHKRIRSGSFPTQRCRPSRSGSIRQPAVRAPKPFVWTGSGGQPLKSLRVCHEVGCPIQPLGELRLFAAHDELELRGVRRRPAQRFRIGLWRRGGCALPCPIGIPRLSGTNRRAGVCRCPDR